MSKGVTPHNYDLRNRIRSTLLRPSDFTPPSHVSTPRATAPPQTDELSTSPTTSLLLDTAAIYTSPVTIHLPLTTLPTTPITATSIITTPRPAPDLRSTTFTPPASSLPDPPTPDSTFQRPLQQDSFFEPERVNKRSL
ncbi:hypothetical protein ACJMK2_013295 [Sinanodonta woodiana]|uniref:Uncharacterized protein n=1 Tax=Sinanodonta woodiana TaxID=1069815 RepID=A0ABD3UZ56_SINWO